MPSEASATVLSMAVTLEASWIERECSTVMQREGGTHGGGWTREGHKRRTAAMAS